MGERDLTSVGGWLLIFIIWIIGGQIWGLCGEVLLMYLQILSVEKANNIQIFGTMMNHFLNTPYGIIYFLPSLGIRFTMIWMAIELIKKKAYAVTWIGHLLLINIVFNIGAGYLLVGTGEVTGDEVGRSILRLTVGAAIWLAYLAQSKRVFLVYGKNYPFPWSKDKTCLKCGFSFKQNWSVCLKCGEAVFDDKLGEQAMGWLQGKDTTELERMVEDQEETGTSQYAPEMVEAARRILSIRSNKEENKK